MDFGKALDRTLADFEISGKWLSEQSGLSQQMISGFRKGRQRVYSDSLELMIGALPFEAQKRFYSRLLGQNVEAQCPSLLDQMEEMPLEELADLMRAIADQLQKAAVNEPQQCSSCSGSSGGNVNVAIAAEAS